MINLTSAADAILVESVVALALGLFCPERILQRFNVVGGTLIVWGFTTGAVAFALTVIAGG